MHKNIIHIWLTGLALLISTTVQAQTCCSGGVPLSSNLGMPPGNSGIWQFSISYDQNVLKTLKDGSNVLQDRSRERITRSVLAEVGYGFSERFSMDVFFSYVNQERTIRQFGNTDFVSTAGIGDIAALLKFRITNPRNNNQNLLIGAGPKIPAGRTDFTRDDGIILNADLQPGSGAWDALLYGFYNYNFFFRPSMGFSSSVVYSFKGINSDYFDGQSYQFGNELLAQLSVGDQLNVWEKLIDVSLTLRFRHQDIDTFNGNELPNTGGRFFFLTPGFSYYLTPSLTVNISGDVPLVTYVEGTQLAPTYRLHVGVYMLLDNKKNIRNLNL